MTDRRILEEAQSAAANAYVPYSHFPVAAVLELKDGTLLSGCNVENASYGPVSYTHLTLPMILLV